MRAQYSHRIIPSRWHRKWKDYGEEHNNGLGDPTIAPHLGAKSRWILQGFHDPDIALLNRTVPTPATTDVPLALQMLASMGASAWVGDVKSAFTQSIKGMRPDRLCASSPADGVPGWDEDILIEVLTEIYGLVSGPPGWRCTLLQGLKDLDLKRHPLAPCVVLMYDGEDQHLCGLICIETDDLLGGGIGDKFHNAVKELKTRFQFGKWVQLQEKATQPQTNAKKLLLNQHHQPNHEANESLRS